MDVVRAQVPLTSSHFVSGYTHRDVVCYLSK